MPNVKVSPIQQVRVKINQGNQQTVHSTSQFVGSGSATDYVARDLANSAYNLALTKYDKTGGLISGNVSVSGDVTANLIRIDAGTF